MPFSRPQAVAALNTATEGASEATHEAANEAANEAASPAAVAVLRSAVALLDASADAPSAIAHCCATLTALLPGLLSAHVHWHAAGPQPGAEATVWGEGGAACNQGARRVWPIGGGLGGPHRGELVLQARQAGFFASAGAGVFEALAELCSAALRRTTPPQPWGATLTGPAFDGAEQPTASTGPAAGAAALDKLTGLAQRAALPRLAQRLHRSSAADLPVSLVLLDVDHFSRVTQVHGAAAGDGVLRGIAAWLPPTLRQLDHCLRWDGAAFLLVLAGADGRQAAVVVDKLRQRLHAQAHALPNGAALKLSASFGVAELQPGEALDHAVARADAALRAAQRGGRNRVVVD